MVARRGDGSFVSFLLLFLTLNPAFRPPTPWRKPHKIAEYSRLIRAIQTRVGDFLSSVLSVPRLFLKFVINSFGVSTWPFVHPRSLSNHIWDSASRRSFRVSWQLAIINGINSAILRGQAQRGTLPVSRYFRMSRRRPSRTSSLFPGSLLSLNARSLIRLNQPRSRGRFLHELKGVALWLATPCDEEI